MSAGAPYRTKNVCRVPLLTTKGSGADHPAVVAADHEGRRPGPAVGVEVRPVADRPGFAGVGVPQKAVASPGCWMLTKRVRWSGVMSIPVISAPRGPTRNRRTLPVPGSATRVWLLPMRSYPRSARFWDELEMSVWIHSRPSGSNHRPSGEPTMSCSASVTVGSYRGSPGQQEDVPRERERRVVAVLLVPTDDVPVRVGVARVDRADRRQGAVGQRQVDVVGARVHGDPLRTVHRGRNGRLPESLELRSAGSSEMGSMDMWLLQVEARPMLAIDADRGADWR